MRICRAIVMVCATVLCSVLCVQAQEDVPLEKIVITASRIPQLISQTARKVDVITHQEIEGSSAENLAELLNEYNVAVSVGSYGGLGAVQTVKMRGSTASQVLVLIDGRPVNSPRDGQLDLSTISLSDIERIEIMRGPGSNLYGSSAMGGTIHLITKKPPQTGTQTMIESSYGTGHTSIERLRHGGRLGKFGYLLSGEYQDSQGFRDNADADAKAVNTKLEYSINDEQSVGFNSGFITTKVGSPGPTSFFDDDDRQRTKKSFGDLDWSYHPDEESRITASLYRSYERLEFYENTAGSMFDVARRKDVHTTKSDGLDIQLSRRLTQWYQGITGFNYVGHTNDSTLSAKHGYTVRAWFIENQFDPLENLKITLGARVDDYSNFGSETSPDGSILYTLFPDTRVRLRLSRSFRAPTFNDLYWPDEGWTRGNPQLKPERGTTGECGIDSRINEYVHAGLTVYRSEFDDLILWAPDATGVWMPQNVGSAVMRGVESEIIVRIHSYLSLHTGYTYLSARDSDTDNYLVYQPRHKINMSLRYDNLNNLVVVLHGQYVGRRYHNAANTVDVKHYYLLGLDITRQLNKNISIFASMDNILNRSYEVIREYPMPGFSVTGGLRVEF